MNIVTKNRRKLSLLALERLLADTDRKYIPYLQERGVN